jgi:alkyl sulfatase BDS1-like metallo-beta-lactamase superfamily hydrolase
MSFEPSCLVPSHTIPITGKETLKEILGNYRDAIKFVDNKVIEALNTSMPLEQLKEEVRDFSHASEILNTCRKGMESYHGRSRATTGTIRAGSTAMRLGWSLFPLSSDILKW